MAELLRRLTASIDRIPAAQAFIFLAIVGAVEGFVLFSLDTQPSAVSAFWFLCLLVPTLRFIRFSEPLVTRRESGSLASRIADILRNLGRLGALHAIVIGPVILGCLAYPFASSLLDKTPAPSTQPSENASPSTAIPTSSAAIASSAVTFTMPAPILSASATTSAPPIPATSTSPSSSSLAPTIATTSSKAAVRAPGKTIIDKPEQPRSRTLGDGADP